MSCVSFLRVASQVRFRAARRLIVPLAFVSTSGCWVPVETGRQIQSDMRELQRELREAQKGIAEQRARLDEQMQRAADSIKEVETALTDLNRAARMTDAEFGVKMERLIREVQELRGTTELADYRLGKIESQLEGEGSLGARVGSLEKFHDGASSASISASMPKDKKELLEYGAKLAKEGAVGEARGVYREVVKSWPKEEGVTDTAYFKLGELYFNEKNYASALQEYIHVVEKFATGPLADDAYYKIAECAVNLGNLEDAQLFYGEVVKNHKRSPWVKTAREKLDAVNKRLTKEQHKKPGGASRKK